MEVFSRVAGQERQYIFALLSGGLIKTRKKEPESWGHEKVNENPRTKGWRKRDLSVCIPVREPLQQVQQAWLFLSSSLDPDDLTESHVLLISPEAHT